VDWDFAIGKYSARTIMGIMIPYTLCIIMWYQEINITDNYVYGNRVSGQSVGSILRVQEIHFVFLDP
jgi:hypothetical protein